MSTVSIAISSAEAKRPRRSPFGRLCRDPQAIVSGSILIVLAILGALAPLIATNGPNDATLSLINAPIGTEGYPLGGDSSGRDIYSRLLFSLGTSFQSALIGTGVALLVGVSAGLIGGYLSNRVRSGTDWLFNLVMTFPGLLVLILLMPVTRGDFRVTMVLFGIIISPTIYRIVRNQVVSVKHELFVDAARVSGLSNLRILTRHVLFVIRGPIIIAAAFLANSAIGAQSGLAFLGLGSTDVPSFGAMIAAAFINLYTYPLQLLWPSLALGLITASLVLLGNSLRDALEGARPKASKAGAAARSIQKAQGIASSKGGSGTSSSLLSIENLAVAYPAGSELVEVVHDVSLRVEAGEIVGLVGESGSGKTQTAFSVLGVLPPEAIITSGRILLEGRDIVGLPAAELNRLRGRTIAYIPQEPMSNLVPTSTVGAQLVAGLRATTPLGKKEAKERILGLLRRVGIVDPDRVFSSYPHQISGGMAQRALIAGAVASRPKLLIADEPTTALDVTVQAEILDLLRDLQAELNMAVLLVTHNFGVVADICDRIAVMQNGQVVESGTALELFREPKHPYTQMLLGSILDEHTVRTDPPVPAAAATGERN